MIFAVYLVLGMASNGGIVAIPMESMKLCKLAIEELVTDKDTEGFFKVRPLYAKCLRARSDAY